MERYKLTIVIPVFNTDSYLEETFECIKNQTIGFENVQLILVNDGSTDNSADVCRRFQSVHKNNVMYIEFPRNQGVSVAKNKGLEMAEGTYITFWDSDDLWSPEAMERAVVFLEKNDDEIDLVSANIEFFEGESGGHPTNFALEESQIIDTCKDYSKIRSAGAATVMKTAIAKGCQFDEEQGHAEDAKFINSIILRKQKYGMLADVSYYYRRRRSADSALQLCNRRKDYYLRDLTHLYEGLCGESMRQYGKVVPMIQYYLAYALGYRFVQNVTVLDEKERLEYDAILKNVISGIEDKYISEITNVDRTVKCMMSAFKRGVDIWECLDKWQQKESDVVWMSRQLGRVRSNYDILKKWFELKQRKWSIADFFQVNGFYKIAIYGMSDLGKFLYEELAGSQIKVVYAIDRRAEKLESDLSILKVEDCLPPVDAVIVTAVYFFEQIKEALKDKVNCPVVSLEDIVCN